jgi:uncharacterized Ntn-hydrolase superfamily protein
LGPSTFSIVALNRQTGEFGVAVASKFLAVGAIVPWARVGVGALATQARANLSFGPDGLQRLAEGAAADEVVEHLTAGDEGREHRQLGVVDGQGRTAAWTGGGDSRGQQSAALLVVKEKGSYGGYLDRYIDLRVDDHPTPIVELRKLLDLHRLYFISGECVLTRLAGSVVREVQEILRGLGFYHGEVTGDYDASTKEAFRRFASVENFEERWRDDDQVDHEVINYIRRRYGTAPARNAAR